MDLETKTGKITGTPTALSVTPKNYTVTATNSGGHTSVTLTIRVIAVCPVVQYTDSIFYSTHLTTSMAATATNLAGVNAALTGCSVVRPALPAGLSINQTTCAITGISQVQTAELKYTVNAINSCGNYTTDVKMFVKAIAPTRLSISGGKRHVVTVDVLSSNQTHNVTGDPVTDWRVEPALPNGMFLTSTGIIAGTPTHVDPAGKNYTVTASNTGGATTYTQLLKVIAQAPSGLAYDGYTDLTGAYAWEWTAGHSYTEEASLATGTDGGATITYTITGDVLPRGMTLNASTGTLSGTPTELVAPWAGMTPRSYVIKASSSGGDTTINVQIIVIAEAPIVSYTPNKQTEFIHNMTISPEIQITNTGGEYANITSCSIVPQLPVGMTLSSSCAIGGTPAHISWPAAHYLVTANNSGGVSTSSFELGVRAIAPVRNKLTGGEHKAYIVNKTTAASFMLIKRDSCDPIISTSVVPALPAGLYFNNSDGTVSGNANETQSKKLYKFTVSNSGGAVTFYQNITVSHNPPRPYNYVANAAARAWKECTITEDRDLAMRYGEVSDAVKSCEAAKSSYLRDVSNLTTYYDSKRTEWQQTSREYSWSLSNVTMKKTNLAILAGQTANATAAMDVAAANYSAEVAVLTRQTAAMEEVNNLKVTTQPSSALNVMDTITATVVARSQNGTIVRGLHGFVHTRLHGVANSEISVSKLVDGVAQVVYQVNTPGNYQLEHSSAGFSQSLHDSAQVCKVDSTTSTTWTGIEIDGGTQHQMNISFAMEAGHSISGSGTDSTGTYKWSGSYKGNKFTMTKTYDASHNTTQYSGAIKTEDNGQKVMMEGTYSKTVGTSLTSGGFHLEETGSSMASLVGTCALTTTSSQFSVSAGPASKVIFNQNPPASTLSNETFNVAAQLADAKGNILGGSATTAYLTIEGGDVSELTATGGLNTTFASGTATFTGVSVAAGKNLRIMMSTPGGQYNVSSKFKATVTPATFTHSLIGMTEEVWNTSEVQLAFRQTIAYHMGETVETDDVTITGYDVTTRRTGGINAHHSVALTNSSQASNAVSGLENATNNGQLANTLKNNAASQGKDLSGVSSGGMSGTSSGDVANTVAAQKAAKNAAASSSSSSSSSDKKEWEITAIVFMALCGLALVAIVALSVMHFKKKKSADAIDHASQVRNDRATTNMQMNPLGIEDANVNE